VARRDVDASRYDTPAPWWFRNIFWLLLPLVLLASVAGATRDGTLIAVTVGLFLVAGVPVLAWEVRHRTKG
jgi:hypothetical protein